nr:hypothetical protein [candidate division Zixibacteria bacterium]
MIRFKGIIAVLMAAILGGGIFVSPATAADRLILPEGVYYHRFISMVNGPEATWINPAGLGLYTAICTQVIGEYYDGEFADNWGLNLTGEGIGIGYRRLRHFLGDDYREYIFGLGQKLSHGFYIGGSYLYIPEGPEGYHKKHLWNLGFILRENPKYSIAATFTNLNRSRVAGEKSDIEQVYSLTYIMDRNLIALSIEVSLSTGQSLSGASYNYGINIYPIKGTEIYASLDNDENFEIGARVNLTQYFLGLQGRHRKGNRNDATSFYAGLVNGSQESLIK